MRSSPRHGGNRHGHRDPLSHRARTVATSKRPRQPRGRGVGQVAQGSYTGGLLRGRAKPVSFQDKTLTCRDCGQEFIWTAGEQEFYASRGLQNAPSRCPADRAARRAGGGGGGGGGGGYGGGQREVVSAVCSNGGEEARR